MRMLAIDTATEVCGIGVWADGGMRVALHLAHGQTHARHLMTGIDAVLKLADMQLAEVEAFAVTHGPGSFTGLRIGISTIKGLAAALERPVVGISSLEALAHQADGAEELICPMIDARRNEVYWSLYRRGANGIEKVEPERVGPVADAAARIHAPCQFIGNGAWVYRRALKTAMTVPGRWSNKDHTHIRIGAVARLARLRLNQKHSHSASEVGPIYLRRSDAELNAGRNKTGG